MNRYFVHITTIPSRFDYLGPAIESWLNQSIPPTRIIISITQKYKRSYNLTDLDRKKIDKFRSNRVTILELKEDYGPNTKIWGAFRIYHSYPEHSVIIADDDHYYHADTAKSYLEMKSDSVLTHYQPECFIDSVPHIKGADSYWLPPKFFQNRLLYKDYLEKVLLECPECYYEDDFVASYFITKVCGLDTQRVLNPKSYRVIHTHYQMHTEKQQKDREQRVIEFLTNYSYLKSSSSIS